VSRGEELKPCPFCGRGAKLRSRSGYDYGTDEHWVECGGCWAKSARFTSRATDRATTYFDALAYAVSAWNRRQS
jgi:hypothetical protein